MEELSGDPSAECSRAPLGASVGGEGGEWQQGCAADPAGSSGYKTGLGTCLWVVDDRQRCTSRALEVEICSFSCFSWAHCKWGLSLLSTGGEQSSCCLHQHFYGTSIPAPVIQWGFCEVLRGCIIFHVKPERFWKHISSFLSPAHPKDRINYVNLTALNYRTTALTFKSSASPLVLLKHFKGWTQGAAELHHRVGCWWMAQKKCFLTPTALVCTDCHFKGWGNLKSLSWCLAGGWHWACPRFMRSGSSWGVCSVWWWGLCFKALW